MIERKIIIACITQTEYLRQIESEWSYDYIESTTARTIATWCWEYFAKYRKAPNRDIELIYIKKIKKGFDKSLAEEIEEILADLSTEYENEEASITYIVEETLAYFKERQVILHSETLNALLSKNKVEEALKLSQDFKLKIAEKGEDEVDLSNNEILSKVESAFDTTYQNVISFPGALGEFWNEQLVRGGLVSLLAPEKRGKCLPENQRVLTASGKYFTIKEIIENKITNIVSFNETTQKFVFSKISKYWNNGIKPVYEVVTKSGKTVQVTLNHPFLTPDGWKELQNINIGEFIATPKCLPFFGSNTISENKIKILAYLISDGCLHEYKTGKGISKIVGYSKADKVIKNDFTFTVTNFGCKVIWNGNDCRIYNSNENKGKHNKNKVITLCKKYEIWNKMSYEKTIPDVIFTLNKSNVSLFLKILFSGDGYVLNNNEIGFSSSSKDLIFKLNSLLIKYGIVTKYRIKKTDKKDAYIISIRDYENIKKFYESIGFLEKSEKQKTLVKLMKTMKVSHKSFLDKFPYQIAQKFYNECDKDTLTLKKASTIREYIKKKKPLMRQSFIELKNTKIGKKYFEHQILWDEIVKINFVENLPTYDLTVENHHNFIAENILVHNTYWLIEFMMRAFLQKRKVAFFQAGDMTESQLIVRIGIYLAKKSNQEKYCGIKYIPIQDCVKNQTDTCTKKVRECDFGVFDKPEKDLRDNITFEELIETYEYNKNYAPCYNCTEWVKNKWGAVWLYKRDIKNPLTAKGAKLHYERFFIKERRPIKISSHVNGTLKVSKIKAILKKWKDENEFVPDVICIDYADLLEPETKRQEFRHQQNQIWKDLRALSQENNCLVLTATQSDADSYGTNRLGLGNFSEDKRKFAHVTAMYGLNQDTSGREKQIGIMRINKIVIREGDFHTSQEVNVLQRLEIGRPFLGSYL